LRAERQSPRHWSAVISRMFGLPVIDLANQ